MYKKVIQNFGVGVINYNIICLKILCVLLCSCMFNLHTNVGLTAWFNNLQNTAIQTLTIVLIIFNKGLTYNVTRTRYEVITHVYKGYHSAFFLIIHFMNENIFKPRHTCTKIQLIFFPIGIVITKTNTHAASGLNRQHNTLTLSLYLRQNQSDKFVLILKGWIRLTFVSSF